MKVVFLSLSLFLAAVCGADRLVAQEVVSAPGAVLRGLDKVAGASTDITLNAGETASFGRLTITLTECRNPADNPAAEAFAHLTIHDPHLPDAVFDGWMIASSPALNAMDHARYDIWVLRCTTS